MASSIPPSTITNTTSSILSSCPLFKKTLQISTSRNRNQNQNGFKLSCKAIDGDQNLTATSGKFDRLRRDVLIGLGGLYGFLFYNENIAELVRVKIKDCLDQTKLGYHVYQDVNVPRLSKLMRKINKSGVAMAAETSTAADVFPRKLDKAVTVVVQRPKKSRSKKQKEEEEEILVIEGIEVDSDAFVKFDVFINEEDEAASGPDRTEFAGSFVSIPHKHNHHKKMMKTRLILGITDLLEDLGAEDDDSVLVSMVPKLGSDSVSVGGVKIEFDS